MKSFVDSVISDLKARKQSEYVDHEKLLISIAELSLPKKSKSLGINLIKSILIIPNDLQLVLTGHLYLEKLVNHILNIRLNDFSLLEKKGVLNTFYKKVMYLRAKEVVDNQILNDLLLINEIRNKYAHKLNYNIGMFDIFKISSLRSYSKEFQIKRESSKKVLHRILFRHAIYEILINLCENHGYLYLVDQE